jgi:hypothetical protein
VADPGWKREFDDPIPLPGGRQLVTLEDAARYIQELPEAEHELEHWLSAVEALLLVVKHNGPTMFARIGMTRALNRDRPVTQPEPARAASAPRPTGSSGDPDASSKRLAPVWDKAISSTCIYFAILPMALD